MSTKRLVQILFVVSFLPASLFAADGPQTVAFPSGKLTLYGILYKPEGKGPFPAVLYNHGSAPGMLSNQAFDRIAPEYVRRNWVFFAPYRRGQGLSASAGPYIGDQINRARQEGSKHALQIFGVVFVGLAALLFVLTRKRRVWVRMLGIALLGVAMALGVFWYGFHAASTEMVRVLETDHLNDQLAAYDWLRQQEYIDPQRIAAAGNSFGGAETVFGAERLKYCAAIDASGGAESWTLVPELQNRMTEAVRNSQAPIFFFQAENDYNLAPSRKLSAAMKDAGKQAEMKIYPAFGKTSEEGHTFAYRGASIWAEDVFRFLDKYCAVKKSPQRHGLAEP